MYTDKRATHFIYQANGVTESFVPVQTFDVNIQPASDQTTVLVNGAYGRTFTAFTTYSGLQVGDAVVASGTTTTSGYYYKVVGVENLNYGPLRHFEVTLTWPEV